jgi:hypothetical protein
MGRAAAKNVEVVFNWTPRGINICPHRNYATSINPEQRFIVSFQNLAPKEFISIDLFAIGGKIPEVTSIRSLEGAAKQVRMRPQIYSPTWVNALILLLMFLGSITFIYLLITAIQILANWVPSTSVVPLHSLQE